MWYFEVWRKRRSKRWKDHFPPLGSASGREGGCCRIFYTVVLCLMSNKSSCISNVCTSLSRHGQQSFLRRPSSYVVMSPSSSGPSAVVRSSVVWSIHDLVQSGNMWSIYVQTLRQSASQSASKSIMSPQSKRAQWLTYWATLSNSGDNIA